MATFFPELHSDGLQTLHLMNPTYAGGGYSTADNPAHPNMAYMGYYTNQLDPATLAHHQQQQQQQQQLLLQQKLFQWKPTPAELTTSYLGPHCPSSSPRLPGGGVGAPEQQTTGSKYLVALQQLLHEVVSAGRLKDPGVHDDSPRATKKKKRDSREEYFSEADGSNETSGMPAGGLPEEEEQELRLRRARLVGMLDEVEQRYRNYHQQVEAVVSSFEDTAGPGSAATYTAVGQRAVSKQFKFLTKSIAGQIKAASSRLGEEEYCLAEGSDRAGGSGGSRLRLVDHHLRQQRALQQMGIVQSANNAWRPQRGLPESAVSVLRAWLFEHFLHPYPKDSDKHMLAKQTGLTRNQVSNWFINARVRLWKPMVEEMYQEEAKEKEKQQQNINGGHDKCNDNNDTKGEEDSSQSSKSIQLPQQNSTVTRAADQLHDHHHYQSGREPPQPAIPPPSSSSSSFPPPQSSQFQMGYNYLDLSNHPAEPKDAMNNLFGSAILADPTCNGGSSINGATLIANNINIGGQATERFDSIVQQFRCPQGLTSHDVSLTLGLQHGGSFPVLQDAHHQPPYAPANMEAIFHGRSRPLDGIGYSSVGGSSSGGGGSQYGYGDFSSIQSKKTFAALLLQDFVA